MSVLIETMIDDLRRGRIIMVDDGYCRYGGTDDVLNIKEMLVGSAVGGTQILARLRAAATIAGKTVVRCRCLDGSQLGAWLQQLGFRCVELANSSGNRLVRVWQLDLTSE